IRHPDCLCITNHITSDNECCATILQYCSTTVHKVIEGMKHFNIPNWDNLKKDILKYFDADRSDERFFKRDLKCFISEARDSPIQSLFDLHSYMRNYTCIADWLQGHSKITSSEYDKYFWKGLPRSINPSIEARLLQKDPDFDLRNPFPYSGIVTTAEHILRRDRFDADDIHLEDRTQDSDSDGSYDSDDDDYARLSKKKHVKIAKCSKDISDNEGRKPVPPREARRTLKKLEREEPCAQQQDEMETIIKQLLQMSLDDPNYGLNYYRAMKRDPDIIHVVRPPSIHASAPVQAPSRLPSTSQPRTFPPRQPSNMPFSCFGCGSPEHGVNDCQHVNDLIAKVL
ncbi:hypothetical protein BV22DRAFT_1026067, partial [Leucogyrophana mollusca]